VSETCQIGARRLKWYSSEEGKAELAKLPQRYGIIIVCLHMPRETVDLACRTALVSGWFRLVSCVHVRSPYQSVDPAPPLLDASVEELRAKLMDRDADLFDRYRAMFALRNQGTAESVLVCIHLTLLDVQGCAVRYEVHGHSVRSACSENVDVERQHDGSRPTCFNCASACGN
jgi:hypothetical protein